MKIFSHDINKNVSMSFHRMGRFMGVGLLTTTLVTSSVFSTPLHAAPSSGELKKKTGDLKNQIQNLEDQLSSLRSEVDEIVSRAETLVDDIEQTKLEMADAQKKGDQQYEDMKLRIKYIYESGGVNAMELLCSSKSFADFLNMSEFVQSINEYDRKMLQNLIDTQNQIHEKGEKLEKQQVELQQMQEELEKKKADIESKLSTATTDLSYYSELLEEVKKAESIVKPPVNNPTPPAIAPDPVAPDEKPGVTPDQKPIEPETPVNPSNKEKLGSFKITHYCPCFFCSGSWGANTATGTVPMPGRTIAVDPGVIPLGSRVEINGHVYIAEDTGGAIRGNKIDIYVADHTTALNSGVYYADVYLLH